MDKWYFEHWLRNPTTTVQYRYNIMYNTFKQTQYNIVFIYVPVLCVLYYEVYTICAPYANYNR